MATILVHEAGSLFVTDNGTDNGKHLTLESAKLPVLEEKTQDHLGGGAAGEISIGGLGLSKLEFTFKLKGFDPQVMSQFGLGRSAQMPFTYYGAIRDKQTGRAIELKAIIKGRLTKLESDELKRGDLAGHDHQVVEILHYELYMDGREKYYFDFFTSVWRVDGVSQNADVNNILRIPAAQ